MMSKQKSNHHSKIAFDGNFIHWKSSDSIETHSKVTIECVEGFRTRSRPEKQDADAKTYVLPGDLESKIKS